MLGVFGGSGTGKTTFARKFICGATSEAVFIFDPEGEFHESLGLPWVSTPEQLDAAARTGWVCFDPWPMHGDHAAGLEWFCRYSYAAADVLPGRKFFVVDELGRYTSGSEVPDSLKRICQAGRRVGLDGVFIGQQPNELHNTIRCQLSEVCCFQLTDDTALEFPKRFGFDVEAVRTLPPYAFIVRNNRGQEFYSGQGPAGKALFDGPHGPRPVERPPVSTPAV